MMTTQRKLFLLLIFIISLVFSAWVYIQSLAFVNTFPSIAKNSSIIARISPETVTLATFIEDVRFFHAQGKDNPTKSLKWMCENSHNKFDYRPIKFRQTKLQLIYNSTLVWCYQSGVGVEKNLDMAIRLYKDIEDQLPAKLLTELSGLLLKNGNTQEMAKYLQRAASMGDKKAMTFIASFYANGTHGFKRSNAKAEYWFRMLHNSYPDKAFASFNLAFFSATGKTRPPNFHDFTKYIQKAQVEEDRASAFLYAIGIENGWVTNKPPTTHQELLQKSKTMPSNTKLYITDFFNESGWSGDEKQNKYLLFRFFAEDLITMDKQKELFLKEDGSKTDMYKEFINTMKQEKKYSSQSQKLLNWIQQELVKQKA